MKRKRTKRTNTKSVLRLPDLAHAKAAVLNSLTKSKKESRLFRELSWIPLLVVAAAFPHHNW